MTCTSTNPLSYATNDLFLFRTVTVLVLFSFFGLAVDSLLQNPDLELHYQLNSEEQQTRQTQSAK